MVYVVTIPDRIICSVLNKNSINLYHSIVKNWLVHGYIGYQNLMGMVGSATVEEYRKAINHKGTEKTTTEVNIIKIPSAKNIRRDNT